MARNKRTCEQCGGTSSPHIPRQRVDGRMLCQGCASRELAKSGAKKNPNQKGAYLKPKSQETFDFWDDDLAPNEELHPLHQPLPNSVWEKYAKHRELLGKPKIMMPDHLEEAEDRAKKGGDSDPFPGSRGEAEQAKKGPGKQQRLPFWRRKKGSLGKTAAENEKPQIESMPGQEAKDHLSMHHGWTSHEIETAGLKGKLYDLHQADHDHPKIGPSLTHSHGASQPAPAEAPHPSSFTPKTFADHMVEHHGWTHENAKTHADAGMTNALSHHKIDHEIDSEGDNELKHTHKGAGEIPHPQGGNELTMHLLDHHGMGDWETDGMDHDDLVDQHEQFHNNTSYSGKDAPDHTHPEGHSPAVHPAGQGKHPHPEDMHPDELDQHVLDLHGIKPAGLTHIKTLGVPGLNGSAHENMLAWHNAHHEEHNLHGGTPHEHEPSPQGATQTSGSSGGLHPPAKTLKGKQLVDHLKNEHDLPHNEIVNAFKSGGDKPLDGGHSAAVKWHDEAHATGAPHAHDHAHEEPGANGPEQLKHPSKFTNNALHGHLLEDHGIDPDHLANAIDGTFEATDPSHVVHMLHNAAHKSGQVKFEHEHEGWKGGPDLHPGHTDVGKPFWGAPSNLAQKSHEHLTSKKSEGGHGLSQDALDELMKAHTGGKKLMEDSEYHEAYEKVHGGLHEQGGDEVNHQHVPTIKPGVMSPAKAKKEQLKQHLKEYHGVDYISNPEAQHSELHDKDAYAYKGHPGHDHIPWDQHGPVLHELPSGDPLPPGKDPQTGAPSSIKPWNPGHHDHPANMSQQELADHIASHHKYWTAGKNGEPSTPPTSSQFADSFFDDFETSGKSHTDLLRQHALHHATGETNGHTHEPGSWDNPLEQYGHEPEVQTDTHPHIESDHEALAHMIKHHPNVTQQHYESWGKNNSVGEKPTMVKFHEAIHNGGEYGASGYASKFPKILDGHDHAEASGPPTQISVGSHLVHDHGMSQEDVAAMTPAEFKAHHEQLHLKKPEFDIGHGHEHPGGPVRDPRVVLPNTHHKEMREDDKHPAVQEWYHGTGTDYEGAPKNATELKDGHGFWGNFGGGDWNNHVGTHWSSLHQMSRNFNGGGNRVIHAKLHMANPIKYNSLNHMAHDAYERLRASGHMQDDGQFEGNHGDDNGYNECCSKRLLEYSKGHHRDDGKFGLEAYRDSLRASGHDGIHVRNHADHPSGHWNAIPLSADQIEITHGGCRGEHGDERDHDVQEFTQNSEKLKKGWVHPKKYNSRDYMGQRLDHLPTGSEVAEANETKRNRPSTNKNAEGRGDSDPYVGSDHDLDSDSDDDDKWCEHCDEHGDHESEDCTTSKWCSVCEEHGDHEAHENHEWCDHCGDYADHGSDDCDKNPDNMKVEAYCPHCDESHEDNKYNSKCVKCDQKLPDWGKLQSQGTPVKSHEYEEDGETDAANYGHASAAKVQGFTSDSDLAAHLYHHHKSDVSGKEFDQNGSWNEDALKHHHQWLHQNPDLATSHGFQMDHEHKHLYGQFPKNMKPEETHAHLMIAHCGAKKGGVSPLSLADVMKMTPEQAEEAHKKVHAADDAVHWGQKDSDGDFIPKISHTHNLQGAQGSFDEMYHPKGEDLVSHIGDTKYHGVAPGHLDKMDPKTVEALHHQLHMGTEPGVGKYHVHTPEMLNEIHQKKAIMDHLVGEHGADPNHYMVKGKSIEELMSFHGQEHKTAFPTFNDPGHTHFGGTAHKDPDGHTSETMKKEPSKADQVKQHLVDHHGAPAKMKGGDLKALMKTHNAEHGKFPILDTPDHEHPNLSSHPGAFENHTAETMQSAKPAEPEPKPEVEFPELHSATVPELLKENHGQDMDMHIDYHHPEVYKGLEHSEGFFKAPGTPEFQKALQEAHEAHMKAHAEGSDHNHGGTAPVDLSKVKLDWPDEKSTAKESSRRTLTDLFEEVAS